MLSVDVSYLAAEGARLLRFRQACDGLFDDAAPVRLQALRRHDGIREGDRTADGSNRTVARWPVLRILERLPAADDLGGVREVDLFVSGG